MLEEEQEMLNSSLIALTTHFAQVRESRAKLFCDRRLVLAYVNQWNPCTGPVSPPTDRGRAGQREGDVAQGAGGICV